LLANVYLHYVFDLWADRWRRREARGEVIIVRFADDYIVGFQHRDDAERFLAELRGRLAQFNLELAASRTESGDSTDAADDNSCRWTASLRGSDCTRPCADAVSTTRRFYAAG
jgi:hypothetical protein